jgi:hypothetical protein
MAGDSSGEVVQLLASAGLAVVGGPASDFVLSPAAAWRLLASGGIGPTASVPYAAPGSAEAVSAAASDLAHRTQVIGREREFLIQIPAAGIPAAGWIRVRCTVESPPKVSHLLTTFPQFAA